jgi:hypothetical protein
MQHQYVHAPSGSLVTVVFVFVTVVGARRRPPSLSQPCRRSYVRTYVRGEKREKTQQPAGRYTSISLDRIFAAVSRPAGV